jgi:hypothetical protein
LVPVLALLLEPLLEPLLESLLEPLLELLLELLLEPLAGSMSLVVLQMASHWSRPPHLVLTPFLVLVQVEAEEVQ